jgi:predicted nucleotidyltransferase
MSERIDWNQAKQVWETTPDVIAVWAFGSAQGGQVGTGSDVDIGVLMASPPTLDERLELLSKLEGALHSEKIDLVVLNEANVILRFEAISGQPLFCRDLARRAEFVSRTAREYEDETAFWRRSLEAHNARRQE